MVAVLTMGQAEDSGMFDPVGYWGTYQALEEFDPALLSTHAGSHCQASVYTMYTAKRKSRCSVDFAPVGHVNGDRPDGETTPVIALETASPII